MYDGLWNRLSWTPELAAVYAWAKRNSVAWTKLIEDNAAGTLVGPAYEALFNELSNDANAMHAAHRAEALHQGMPEEKLHQLPLPRLPDSLAA